MFDGNKDLIEKITIEYFRQTKIKTDEIIDSNEYITWNYNETLVLDKLEENIEHIQRIGTGCIVTRNFKIEGGVESLFEEVNENTLFANIVGNPPDILENPNETIDYRITINFERKPQRIITGKYDKNDLPED